MTPQEKACRQAWAESHFGDCNLTDEELSDRLYTPPENFTSGFDKGAQWALQNQWKDPKTMKPDVCTYVLVQPLDRYGCIAAPCVGLWDGAAWYSLNNRTIRPYAWMRLPPPIFHPEKE